MVRVHRIVRPVKTLVLLALSVLTLAHLRADVRSKYYSEFDGQSIDIDGDGVADIGDTFFSFEQQRFFATLRLDYTDIPGTYATADGKIFAGAHLAEAESRDALRSAAGFEIDFVPPTILQRQEQWPSAGYISATEENPVIALWFYGTKGQGTDPFRLVAVIIDASEYFSGHPVPFIHIYSHNYRDVTEGGAPFVSSLADTGFSTELDEAFIARSAFEEFRRIRFVVPHPRTGWRYQVYRREPDGSTEIVKEAIGADSRLIIEWDDRPKNARSAFFWLKEQSAVEFSGGP